MCGIAGLVATGGVAPQDEARVITMRDVIAHRGPDAAGLHADGFAVLGHRRLSIVDLATGGQPMSNEDGTVWVIYNGEIYNHADVRTELEARGHRYRTRSDTETIVHAYEEWGEACVERMRGMFAFAVWDAPRRRLLLARDRLGVKPLYWTEADGRLLFASEIKALLASGLVRREPNLARLPEQLATRTSAGPETLFVGVHKLLPGHVLVAEGGRVRTRQYWDFPIAAPAPEPPTASARRELVVEFRERLRESVRLRLMSDVPLGMFLSGGIDSSAIAALMAPMLDRPLRTFSVAFADRAFSELEYAREVARAVAAERHEVVIDEHDFFGALPRMIWHEDEPIAHPSSVPLYFVSALARRHVTVVLTGEGSDELLAGYGRYPRSLLNWRAASVYGALMPEAARTWIRRHVVDRLPGRFGRLARRSFLSGERTPHGLLFDPFASVPLHRQRELLAPALAAMATPAGAYGPTVAHLDAPASATLLDRLLYADVKTYLVELLMKQDQMSMAASIESRVPFLDHVLVEFAARLPASLKLSGATGKRILREAMKGVLPDSVLERRKMGFPVPFAGWMRGPWGAVARDVLLDRRTHERGILDVRAVDALLQAHRHGREDAWDPIWSLLNLELWFRTFIDGDGIQHLPAPAAFAGAGARAEGKAAPVEHTA